MVIHKHESFCLRKGWLHKGIMYIKDNPNPSFTGYEACDELGIGKNMVKSLHYWLQATQMVDFSKKTPRLTSYANIIIENDPYFIEMGTNYFVHYSLASNKNMATSWWWLFNQHKGTTIEKTQFVSDINEFLSIYLKEGKQYSENVLESEFSTLIRTYFEKDVVEDDPEETKICPLTELRLIKIRSNISGKKIYTKVQPDKDDIDIYILFGIICHNLKQNSDEILINELLTGDNNIGKIFNLDKTTIFYLIEKIQSANLIKITRTAGLDTIRIHERYTIETCLKRYYDSIKRGGHKCQSI